MTLDETHPLTVKGPDGTVAGTVLIGDSVYDPILDGSGHVIRYAQRFVPSITGGEIRYLSGNVLASRKRLDGCWGFQLLDSTNTDTLISAQERGMIGDQIPTSEVVSAIQGLIETSPTDYANEPIGVYDSDGNRVTAFI